MNRSTFLSTSATAAFTFSLGERATRADAAMGRDVLAEFAAAERRSGGRLGVFARDTSGHLNVGYRKTERFPMCSTFKFLLVSAVLQRVDRGHENLERAIRYGPSDLQEYGPLTEAHVRQGHLTVGQLCKAAIELSDNTAANLLLRALGGPENVTAFVRAKPIGDPLTRLDRTEPTLNTAIPGDPRDTTSPAHMAHAIEAILTTHAVLRPASSQLLEAWMRACSTGTTALRAGVPASWVAGDKTGSGDNGTRNDVAIFRPAGRAPIVVAAYLTGATSVDADGRAAVLAHIGRIVAATFS